MDILDLLTAGKAGTGHPEAPLLSPATLSRRLAISKSTLARWRKHRRIPPPDLSEGRIVRWDPETITAWLKSRKPRTTHRAASPERKRARLHS